MKKKIKKAKKFLLTIPYSILSLMVSANLVHADNIGSSKLITGTQSLFSDLTSALMVLSPIVAVALIIYFLIRKSAADEVDQKKWHSRIVVTVVCAILVVVASALVNVILSYFK